LIIRQRVRLSAVLAVLAFYPGHGWADTWQQTRSAKVATEYDSNPNMAFQSPQVGIWRAYFEPSYTLKNVAGANELGAGIALQVVRSSNKTLSQNREDPRVFIDWLRRSNTGEFGVSAKYEEIATRYAAIDNIATAFSDSTRASSTLSGNWSNELSEYSTLSADGSYQRVSYKDGPFVNYANQSAGLKFSHALSVRNTLFIKMSKIIYVPVGGNSSDVTNSTLGWEWKAADYLEGSFQAGKFRSSSVGYGTQGMAEVKYTGQQAALLLNAGREVSPSGLGGFAITDLANGNWSYAMSELSKIGIELGWQKNHFTTDIINSSTGAWLQHDLNSSWVVRTNFLHRNSRQSGVGKAYANILGVAFTYTHADF
jgi:hypothetical protein